MPKTPVRGLSAEQDQDRESDDLAQLLAATNAKRVARGKTPLNEDDVTMQLWATEQEMRRSRDG
jgi:hypothetical protein